MSNEVNEDFERQRAEDLLRRQAEANPVENLPPVKIAFIIDNELVDILHTDDRLAAIFLSQPTIIDISDLLPLKEHGITIGSTYNPETNTFTLPASSEE